MSNPTRVMYVDDESDIRGIIEYALEDEPDFSIELCASGQEALNRIDEFKPDLILLDVMMPGMDGPTTLKKLRTMSRAKTTPVMFVTAKVQPNEVAQYKALGAVDVITKPFDPLALAQRLRNHMQQVGERTQKKKSDKFEHLKSTFISGLPQRFEEIEENWRRLVASPANTLLCEELQRQLHSLVGTGLSFGFKQMGELARTIEDELGKLVTTEQTLTENFRSQIEHHIQQLRTTPESTPVQNHHTPADTQVLTGVSGDQRLLYIVEDDPILLELMTNQLELLGWEVQGFTDASSARQALKQRIPSAITVDLSLPEGKLAGVTLLQKFNDVHDQHIPQIVLSSAWNWESRLAAARAGVDAYLIKPLDIMVLTEHLDRLTKQIPAVPYRILIVDDSVNQTKHYISVLEQAGMEAQAVTKPRTLLDALTTFQPELILMKIDMPGCSGIEVARVIRQDSKYLSVPIVFLSDAAERQQQLGALHSGADDFLVKPISDPDLVTAVSLRAERFRSLSAIMQQDSLTGLLNHVTFKIQLEIEFARAKRNSSSLCLVMLDIDYFKKVNDNYGHPAGDSVLKNLAKLLSRRLRKSDVIGRYGGEEFAVLMPDTSLEEAMTVLDNLRQQFSSMRFGADQSEFNCSFSAGIATSLACPDPDTLLMQADSALYHAKQNGRDRICQLPL